MLPCCWMGYVLRAQLHSISCVLPAMLGWGACPWCTRNNTCLRASMALSHESVTWWLRHSVSLYRGFSTQGIWLTCSHISLGAVQTTEALLLFQGQCWALLSSTAHCCQDQRRMLLWLFCCHNKSCATQQRKFGILTGSFLSIHPSPSLWNTPQHSWMKEAVQI